MWGRAISTNITSDVAIEPGKHQITVTELIWRAPPNYKLTELFGHWPRLLPFHSFPVFLPGRSLRSSNCVESEVRMQGEQEDEPLSYGPRSSEDAYEVDSVIQFRQPREVIQLSLTALLFGEVPILRCEMLGIHRYLLVNSAPM